MIRPATHEDIEAVVALGREMHAECWASWAAYAPDRVRTVLQRLVDHGFLWVHEHAGKVDGTLAGFVADCWYADMRVAGEFGLYVRPDLAGGVIAMRLIKQFVQWATEQGAQEITLGITTGVNIHETGRLYERLGFELVGGNYKMRIDHVHRS